MFDYKISVTQRHINRGDPGSIAYGPISLAIDEAIDEAQSIVEESTIGVYIDGVYETFRPTNALRAWIKQCNGNQGPMRPIEICLVRTEQGPSFADMHTTKEYAHV